jgi:hypothetical protein
VKYTKTLETLFTRHRIMERLDHLRMNLANSSHTELQATLNRLDKESANYMRAAGKCCQKLKPGLIPFSLEAMRWIRRKMVLSSIVAFKLEAKKNRGNLVRLAQQAGIDNPLSMSLPEAKTKLQICNTKCELLQKTGWLLRRQHLRERCEDARTREDAETLHQILAIIKHEQDKASWSRLRLKTGKRHGRSVSLVQVKQTHGGIEEYSTQDSVQSAIFRKIHRKRFFLAEAAPICQGPLREAFGYLARSAMAEAILDGSYDFLPDFDEATRALCVECARIRTLVPPNSVSHTISSKQ